jgi:hypothetical protein
MSTDFSYTVAATTSPSIFIAAAAAIAAKENFDFSTVGLSYPYFDQTRIFRQLPANTASSKNTTLAFYYLSLII